MKSWARTLAAWLMVVTLGCSHDWDSLRAESNIADHVCDASDVCDFACTGAGCTVQCSGNSVCSARCPDGDCQFDCLSHASCDFSCDGGGCVFVCDPEAGCFTSCAGGECTTR